jgi:hypothetical protein
VQGTQEYSIVTKTDETWVPPEDCGDFLNQYDALTNQLESQNTQYSSCISEQQ